MSDEIYRAIGRLEGKVDAIAEHQRTMDDKLEDVVTMAHQARGGLRTLASVGAIAGAVGGALGGLFMKLKGGGGGCNAPSREGLGHHDLRCKWHNDCGPQG